MITLFVLLALLPLALLWQTLRCGFLMWRASRRRQPVPLAQRNMTRATFGGFVVALLIGLAATGMPFRTPVAVWALAGGGGLGLLYLIAGVFGSQGARFDVISVVWWGVGAFACAAMLLHLEGMI